MAAVNKRIDKLRLVHWNIQGLRSKYEELRSILSERKVLVACLQETLLGDSQFQPMRSFKLEKSPHFGGENNRGVALMIHGTLQHTRLRLNTTLEAVAVTVHSGKRYTVCSMYLSPNRSVDKSEIRSIIHQLPCPFLFLADFNGKHHLWNPHTPPDQRSKDRGPPAG